MDFLEVANLKKTFGDATAVDDVSLSIDRGEFVTLLGPSGCGKTTTLRMLSGIVQPDSGDVLLEGRSIRDLPAHRRPVATVFQDYALFPHLTILANIEFGLKMARVKRAQRREIAYQTMERVSLPVEFGDRYPSQLSGGQRQRVALARALAVDPPLLLLDEPLSSIDAKLRHELRVELRRILKDIGTTSIFVTHDLVEAFEIADRVAVMSDGRIEQFASPQSLYTRPASAFVASFVGHRNVLEGEIVLDKQRAFFKSDAGPRIGVAATAAPGRACVVLATERIEIGEAAEAAQQSFHGKVADVIYKGQFTEVIVETDGGVQLSIERESVAVQEIQPGEMTTVGWNQDVAYILPAVGDD